MKMSGVFSLVKLELSLLDLVGRILEFILTGDKERTNSELVDEISIGLFLPGY